MVGFAVNAGGSIIRQGIDNGRVDWGEVLDDAGKGALSSFGGDSGKLGNYARHSEG